MNLIDQAVNNITEKFAPHVRSAATTANKRTIAILNELKGIREAVESTTFDESLRNIGPITLVAGTPLRVADVPISDQWQLFEIIAIPATVTTQADLTISDGTLVRYSQAFIGNVTDEGYKQIFGGGSAVILSTVTGPLTVYLMFKQKIRTERLADQDPIPAISPLDNSNWDNGIGPMHEGNRDLLDSGTGAPVGVATELPHAIIAGSGEI